MVSFTTFIASLHPMTPPPFNIQAYCSKKVPAVFQKGGYSFSAIPHRKRIGRRNVFGEPTGYSRFESVCGELSLFLSQFLRRVWRNAVLQV